jgi:hypothetical protein
MKKMILGAALALTSIFALAQKKIDEGTILYTVDFNSAGSKRLNTMMPKEIRVYFKGDSSCVESITSSFSTKIILNQKTGAQRFLVDIPKLSKKIAVQLTPEEIGTLKANFPDLTFTEESQTKSIASFNGKKYKVFNKRNSQSSEAVFTKELDVPGNALTQYLDHSYGFPLEFTGEIQGTAVHLLVEEIREEKVPAGIFTVGGGYEEMSYSQLREMSGGR